MEQTVAQVKFYPCIHTESLKQEEFSSNKCLHLSICNLFIIYILFIYYIYMYYCYFFIYILLFLYNVKLLDFNQLFICAGLIVGCILRFTGNNTTISHQLVLDSGNHTTNSSGPPDTLWYPFSKGQLLCHWLLQMLAALPLAALDVICSTIG